MIEIPLYAALKDDESCDTAQPHAAASLAGLRPAQGGGLLALQFRGKPGADARRVLAPPEVVCTSHYLRLQKWCAPPIAPEVVCTPHHPAGTYRGTSLIRNAPPQDRCRNLGMALL